MRRVAGRFRGGTHAELDREYGGLSKAAPSSEAQARLVPTVGGLSVALARTFKILEPSIETPTAGHWETATRIFDLLM